MFPVSGTVSGLSSGEKCALVILIVSTKLQLKVPESVATPTFLEMLKNGVTAKKSLPKIR